MPSAAIDACCMIDLLASGHAEVVLRAGPFSWQLPTAVQGEVRYVRQHDPAHPGQMVKVAADLSGLIASGVLTVCSPKDRQELERFTHYATVFRSDGEAMCLALAERRGWVVATDDRKAIRVARQAGLTVASSPALVKKWAAATAPSQAVLKKALQDIEVLAQFKPNPSMPEYKWWNNQLGKSGP